MSKDNNCGNSDAANWEKARFLGKILLGRLLKLAGVLIAIVGIVTFALANMDTNPTASMISGAVTTFAGIVIFYLGYKISKKAKAA